MMKYIKFQNDEGFTFIEEFKSFKQTCIDGKYCCFVNGQIVYGDQQLLEKRITDFVEDGTIFLDLTKRQRYGD